MRRNASGDLSTATGASGGPVSLPSHARRRIGTCPPKRGATTDPSRSATPPPTAASRASVVVMAGPRW